MVKGLEIPPSTHRSHSAFPSSTPPSASSYSSFFTTPYTADIIIPIYTGGTRGSGIHAICPWFYNLHEGKLIPKVHALFTPHCLPNLPSKGLLGDLGTPGFGRPPILTKDLVTLFLLYSPVSVSARSYFCIFVPNQMSLMDDSDLSLSW